jgi:hypothetical protein
MKKMSLKLFFGVMIVSLGFSHLYGQDATATMLMNAEGKKLTTIVMFTGIPAGVNAVWKQDITDATFMRIEQPFDYPYWDTNKNILTIKINPYPAINPCSFIFTCIVNKKNTETLMWGKSMMSYTTKDNADKYIIFTPKPFTLVELKNPKNHLELHSSRDAKPADIFPDRSVYRTSADILQTLPQTPAETAVEETNQIPQEPASSSHTTVEVKTEEPKPVVVETPTTPTVKTEEPKPPVQTVVVSPSHETHPPLTPQTTQKTTDIPPKQSVVYSHINPLLTDNLEDGRYYIQFSAQSQPRNLALVRDRVKLLPGDKIMQRKIGDMYKCIIGPYDDKDKAINNLEYYRQFFAKLFVAQYKD